MNIKYINVGLVKEILNNKLVENSINENFGDVNSQITNFISIISESEILRKEYELFESLENKIPSEIIASRYIDKLISLFENYTEEEILNEHSKLKKFLNENIKLVDKKKNYYDDVSNLIFESLKTKESLNTSLLFESYSNILENITNKNNITVNNDVNDKESKYNNINETVLNIAVEKFNKKYSNINENDISLLKKLINSTYENKKDIFEEFKNENISLLESMYENEYDKTKINKAINKIHNLENNKTNINENILKLYDLNISLKND